MEKKEIEKIGGNLKEARELLEEITQTPFEGIHANVKRALISIYQARYDLGEEET